MAGTIDLDTPRHRSPERIDVYLTIINIANSSHVLRVIVCAPRHVIQFLPLLFALSPLSFSLGLAIFQSNSLKLEGQLFL